MEFPADFQKAYLPYLEGTSTSTIAINTKSILVNCGFITDNGTDEVTPGEEPKAQEPPRPEAQQHATAGEDEFEVGLGNAIVVGAIGDLEQKAPVAKRRRLRVMISDDEDKDKEDTSSSVTKRVMSPWGSRVC
jgi:hypothetical protein